jgi:ABC-2 type transport system permease protein
VIGGGWVSPARAAWLLVRLRLARLFNQVVSSFQRFRRKSASGQRSASPGKSKIGWLVGTLVAVSMLFSFTNIALQAVSNMQERLGTTTERRAEQGWLGAQLNALTLAEAQALGWQQPRGARLTSTVAGSPATKAGLLPGDIVLAMDDRDIDSPTSVIRALGAKAPGALVRFRLLRDGKEQRVEVTLAQRPQQSTSAQAKRVRLPAQPGYVLSAGVLQACGLEAIILLVATLLMSLASREFSTPDWDLEWLATFPVSFSTLLGVRIVERTLVNPAGLLALWPFLSIVAWECGYRFAAPILGLAATLLLLVIMATIWTIVDTGLRLRVSAPKLRNLQAMVSVTAVACLYLAMSTGLSGAGYVIEWSYALPAWTDWLPPGLAIGALASATPQAMAASWMGLAAEAVACTIIGFAVLNRQLRFGVVGAAGRESGGRGISRRPARAWLDRGTLLSPIQARELRLLGRDRNFLVQTLILPMVILGAQTLFNAPGGAFAAAFGSAQHVAAAAFGIAAYALMFSAFQTLNAEGQALWILYTVPKSLPSILRQKALLWGGVCLVYAVAILSCGMALHPTLSFDQLELFVVVVLGVPIFAVIATALGVFACDPLAQLVQRRLRPSYVYLYMLLASLYAYAIFAGSIWQRTGLVVLSALLGLALWQKARDHLPFLLDPDASPPARVSVADGLIAALLFFVLQGVIAVLLAYSGDKVPGRVVVIAFAVAGAVTCACMRFAFWRLKTQGVPKTFGAGAGRAAVLGAVGGATAAIAAFLYLKVAEHSSLFEGVRQSIFTGHDGLLWLTALAVVAAPIFEEFIFRGLIFGGLRRLLGLVPSVLASAAIFAVVHPPAAVIPVFGLGVAAALVYEATGLLLGPMIVHAVYNAAVVAYQSLF